MDGLISSPVPLELPASLRIVSFNCWGLKFLAKYRHERLSEIGTQIANIVPAPHIVGLQECWTQQDYLEIRKRTQDILPYGKFYWSGIFGGGLAILSKWPIEESNMVRYPLNGRPTAFFRGDWFVGKGVACARIRIGPAEKDVLEVFNTHLHAPYEAEPHDSYICHRTAQAWEIARLMRHAAERGHLVIGLGDFNMVPKSLAHQLIESHAPVKDVWRIVHPDSAIGSASGKAEKARGRPIPTAEQCISEHGTTCDSNYNTWRWNKGEKKKLERGEHISVDGTLPDPRAKRLDYVFFGGGSGNSTSTWTVEDVKVGMLQRHPDLLCSLSDHFSIETTIVRSDKSLANGHNVDDATADMTLSSPRPILPIEVYDEIMAMTHSYELRQRRQRRLRLCHFGGQLVISIGCLVASWWSPRNFVCFLLMLLSTLGLSAGVIDGLIGGLFVGSELRCLKEFKWEITNAKRLSHGEKGS